MPSCDVTARQAANSATILVNVVQRDFGLAESLQTDSPAPALGGTPTKTNAGLMTHSDPIAPVVVAPKSSHVSKDIMFPFPDRTLESILGRKRLIKTISWPTTTAGGTRLATLHFPEEFTVFSNIMEKLSNFAFIQFDVELELRVVGSPANSGLLNICPHPGAGEAASSSITWVEAIWFNPHELDVGQPAPLIMTIPFVHPNYAMALPFRTGSARLTDAHSAVYIFVEHPLRNMDGTASTVQVEVYARMVNVRTGGDVVSNLNAAQSPLVVLGPEELAKYKAFLQQEKPRLQSDKEALQRLHQALPGPGEMLDTAGSFAGDILGSVVRDVAGGALFSRPVASTGPTPMVQDALFGSIGSSRPVMHDVAALRTLYKTDKIPYQRFGDPRPFETLNDIASLPGPIARWTVTPSSTVGSILATIPVTPGFNSFQTNSWMMPTPANWVAHHCAQWRGTMKYRMRFTSPQTLPSRIGYVWYPFRSLIPTTGVLSNIGDAISGIIDCTGSGAAEFSIPWLSSTPVVPVVTTNDIGTDTTNNGYLVFFIVNPPSAVSTTSPSLEITLWAACERDTQWNRPTIKTSETSGGGWVWQPLSYSSSLVSVVPDNLPLGNVDPNAFNGMQLVWDAPTAQSLADAFSKPYSAPDSTMISGAPSTSITDAVVTLADIYQRYSSCLALANAYFFPNTPLCPDRSWNNRRVAPQFGMIFRFWRGSRIVRLEPITTSPHPVTVLMDEKTYETANGLASPQTTAATCLQEYFAGAVVIPWECLTGEYAWNALCSRWIPDTAWIPIYALRPMFSSSAQGAIRLAFADDFQLGGLAPPPWLYLGQPA